MTATLLLGRVGDIGDVCRGYRYSQANTDKLQQFGWRHWRHFAGLEKLLYVPFQVCILYSPRLADYLRFELTRADSFA